MLRTGSTAISIALLACTCINADDYLLRLETTASSDKSQNGRRATEQILESIEVIARVNHAFYGSSTIGSGRMSIAGTLEQLEGGRFRVNILYRKSADSGESVPGPNGIQIPIRKSMSIDTMAIVELHKTAELAKDVGGTRAREGTESVTETRTLLSLREFDAGRN